MLVRISSLFLRPPAPVSFSRPPLRPAAGAGPGATRGNLAPCAVTFTGLEGEAAAGVAIYKAVIEALDLNCTADPDRADIK